MRADARRIKMANQVKTIINVQRDNRDRITVLFRGVLVLPALVYLMTLMQMWHWGVSSAVITLPVILTLIFRGKYPSYILTFNHAMMELSTRFSAYMLFLTDDYPSIERNENIAVLFPDVEGGKKLSRWQPIFKLIFAIPLIWALKSAFTPTGEIFSTKLTELPSMLSLNNVKSGLSAAPFGLYFLNSLLVFLSQYKPLTIRYQISQ